MTFQTKKSVMGLKNVINVVTLSRLTAIAIFIWLILLLYISTVLVKVQYSQTSQSDPQEGATREATALEALERIKQASKDIEALKRQNEELKQILYESSNRMAKNLQGEEDKRVSSTASNFKNSLNVLNGANNGRLGHLSPGHEQLRRQIENGIDELWYFILSELRKVQDSGHNNDLKQRVDLLMEDLRQQHGSLKIDIIHMARLDGADRWRREKLRNLSSLVQRRLDWLQNPDDCSRKKLLCNLNKGCGFGCQIHHAAYCFMMAYGTERTMVLETSHWRYAKHKSWTHYFKPTGNKCSNLTGKEKDSAVMWTDNNQSDQLVTLPIVDALRNPPQFLPLAFPEDISRDLLHAHGAPPVWWVAQFVTWLMRPSDGFAEQMAQVEKAMKINDSPIVGLHVRRTDKVGAEAAFHGIEEYMAWAEHWFRTREMANGKKIKRRIYLATDDTELLEQTRKQYPNYEVLGDSNFAASAQLNKRYTDDSLRGVLIDIQMLSKCDYIVCTFSSQVCRVAYEQMQYLRGDASTWVHSLDDIYYFGGQQAHEQIAWTAHHPREQQKIHELEFERGDIIGVAGNHWDGFSKGKHKRSGKVGLYPSYKTRERWRIVKMPSYDMVK